MMKKAEAEDQRNRVKVALGAGGIGAVTCFMLPVIGGVTLAACGAAAAVGLTTRSDDIGDAARASGQAAAGGVERLGASLKKNKTGEKVRQSIRTTADKVGGALKPKEEVLQLEDAGERKKQKGWFAAWRGETEEEKRAKRDAYGAAPTASEAAELMVRDLEDVACGSRRRVMLELVRDLHPDKCDGSIAARAVAKTLTQVAILVRDYMDDVGWESFEEKGVDAVAKDCAALVSRNDF